MKSLILIMQFLTKLPLPIEIDADEKDFTKGIIWFPTVGFIIGLLSLGVFKVSLVFANSFVAIVLVVAFEIFITGGLHLDGLADTFDGLYSYRDKEKMLEIMKDSRVGTNGVLILVMDILLKIALLTALTETQIVMAIILMPIASRFCGVILAKYSKYAREKGMGGFFIGKVSNLYMALAMLMTLVYFMINIQAAVILPIMIVLTFTFRNHVYRKIDGITGDVLGAWIEMSELLFLMIYIMVF